MEEDQVKQFYVLQGQTKRIHPLVNIEGVLIIDVPRASNYAGKIIPIEVDGKQIPFSVSPTASIPCLPVFEYETKSVKVINSSLLITAISEAQKDFLNHDYIITGGIVGLYHVEVAKVPLNPKWQVPSDEELKKFGKEYQERKIAKMKELNNER
jgi:hypothetical protein